MLILLCLAPLVLALAATLLLGTDVLYWDEWMVWQNMLHRLDNGMFRLSSLIAQQNDHRLLSARALDLFFTPFTRLDRHWAHIIVLVLTVPVCLGLMALFKRTEKDLDLKGQTWIYPAFALLGFSLMQWENYLFGMATAQTTTALCVVLGLLLLANRRLGYWKFLVLVLAGWMASFNFTNGLFYWICMLLPLALVKRSARARLLYLTAWVALGITAWVVFFQTYIKPPHHPPFTHSLEHPASFVGYYLSYLGGAISSDKTIWILALVLGAIGLCLFLYNLLANWKQARQDLPSLAPWLALALFALMTDLSTSVGRAGFGVRQALESRYVLFSNFFWFAFLALLAASLRLPSFSKKQGLVKAQKYFVLVCAGAFALSTVLSTVVMVNRKVAFDEARQELYTLADNDKLAVIFPDPPYLKTMLPTFFAKRITVFRDVPRMEDCSVDMDASGGTVNVEPLPHGVVKQEDGRQIGHAGLLLSGQVEGPAQWVLVTAQGKAVYATKPDPDSGEFKLFLPSVWLDGPTLLDIYACDGKQLRPLSWPRGQEGMVDPPQGPQPEYTFQEHFFSL